MVDNFDAQLDLAFAALADPTRRAILQRLAADNGLSVTRIAEPFSLSLPGVMKHLDVLARAKLIERVKCGRTVRCRISAAPMETAVKWLSRYERFWSERLDALAPLVEEEGSIVEADTCQDTRLPASASSARSKPRRKRSSPLGRSRKP
jgi:DNA-binding transcriptional ArsR family regulator